MVLDLRTRWGFLKNEAALNIFVEKGEGDRREEAVSVVCWVICHPFRLNTSFHSILTVTLKWGLLSI